MSTDVVGEQVEKQFEQLASLEKEFEQVDTEILRQTALKQAPLFERRNKITSEIPGFWPHVFEDSASNHGFDEHITPEDAACITAMTAFVVTRPDAQNGGDPRNIDLTFTFSDNTYMPAQTITKKFIHKDVKGLTGLVSEPVKIEWKEGKDLTKGINKAAVEAFEERKANAIAKKENKDAEPKLGEKEKHLAKLVNKHTSFFNWFSFTNSHPELGECSEDGEAPIRIVDGMQSPVEAFIYGDELAIQLADDVYPNAVRYFTESIEEDSDSENDSDIDLDSDMDEAAQKALIGSNGAKKLSKRSSSEDDESEDEEPSKKKIKK